MKIARFLLQSMVLELSLCRTFPKCFKSLTNGKGNSLKKNWGYFIIINPFFSKNKAFCLTFFYSNICTKIFTTSCRPVLLGENRLILSAYSHLPISTTWIWHSVFELDNVVNTYTALHTGEETPPCLTPFCTLMVFDKPLPI